MAVLQESGTKRERPEECNVGDYVLAESVSHWDGRIRLTEFTPTNLAEGEKPWIFAARYVGLDPVDWHRVE